MNIFHRLIFLSFLLCAFACTTLKQSSSLKSSTLTMERIEKLTPGVTSRQDILNEFGAPNKIVNLTDLPEQKDDGEIWTFLETPSEPKGRLSFYFEKHANVTSSIGWNLREDVPETNLSVAKERIALKYKNIAFRQRENTLNDTVTTSGITYFEDLQHGVVIFYSEDQKIVDAITWSEPKVLAKKMRAGFGRLSSFHGSCFLEEHGNAPRRPSKQNR